MVDENQFRATYHEINELRCVFEKALNARQCGCARSKHFLLGGREGRGCQVEDRQKRCVEYLKILRPKAKFLLGITQADGPLPHNKEIRIQVGGLKGLQQPLDQPEAGVADGLLDIDGVISTAESQFGALNEFPYEQLLPAIAAFQGRRKRRELS